MTNFPGQSSAVEQLLLHAFEDDPIVLQTDFSPQGPLGGITTVNTPTGDEDVYLGGVQPQETMMAFNVSYNLNSLKGGYIRDYIGDCYMGYYGGYEEFRLQPL